MKKLIIFLILAMFFIVSCGDSKKTENNDADIMPDEDEISDEETDDKAEPPFFVNVCTGLTKCYNNEKEIKCPKEGKDFYGQDVNYAELEKCVPQKFKIDDSVENEPVVIDLNTGLEWQQNFEELIGNDYMDAYNYCENLKYGGHDDWRLPSIHELNSIIDRSGKHPAVNTEYFPETPPNDFLTVSGETVRIQEGEETNYTDMLWIADFADGSADVTNRRSNKVFTRCVRGNESFMKIELWDGYFITPAIYYVDHQNRKAEIFIAETNYSKSTWKEALDFCQNQNYAEISGWRLPDINELTFFFFSSFFHQGRNIFFWTSTSYADDPTKSWVFKLDENSISSITTELKKDSGKNGFIVCVHDAPCKNRLAWDGTKCLNLCDPNPCNGMEHSTGECKQKIIPSLRADSYTCGCDEESAWYEGYKKCVTPCDPNPCEEIFKSDGVCTPTIGSSYPYKCGCEGRYEWEPSINACVEWYVPEA